MRPRARHHVRRRGSGSLAPHRTTLTPRLTSHSGPQEGSNDAGPVTEARRSRADRDRVTRRDRGAAAGAHAVDAQPCLHQCAVLPEEVRRAGRPPQRPDGARGPENYPFTVKTDLRDNYPFGLFAVPETACAGSTDRAARPASRSSSATPRTTSTCGPTSSRARSGRQAGVPGMKVHNAYGYGLFTGGLGLHAGAERLGCAVIPMSGGQTERQVQLITDFKPDIIVVTPVLHAVAAGRDGAAGRRPAQDLAQDRHLRRRALDRGDAPGDGAASSTCTPSTSTGSPR